MRPSEPLRRRMIGILCAAHELYPLVKLHAFAVLSNHWEFLASCDCAEELALYIGYVNGNFARECGRVNNWSGPFWSRRVRMIPCLDDAATIDRLRYCIAQGAKEGLVASPLDWPGATAVPALVGDMTLVGERVDRSRLRRAREAAVRSGQSPSDVHESDYIAETTLKLVALPALANLEAATLRQRHNELLREVVRSAEIERQGRPALGTDMILSQDPHASPIEFAPTNAPMCHSSSSAMRKRFRRLRNTFVAVYRDIAESIKLLLSPRAQRQSADVSSARNDAASSLAGSLHSGLNGNAHDEEISEPSLHVLLSKMPPGMFLSPRFVHPSKPTLLADLAYGYGVHG
jgi:hypothetical protein